ncbi:MAG TPA: cyclomaltodextrin glucanotransferase [Xanthomonadales bacterium]|nr:cyclomaltodextrin glucanotransferase [Xanthomonadales bacterium]
MRLSATALRTTTALALSLILTGCERSAPDAASPPAREPSAQTAGSDYYGTLEPFAAEAVYFVVTDRFVNGDPGNDQRDQGGAHPSFDIPLPACDGVVGNIGYLGGDFRGLLDQADYIREMGFSAVWITPIPDNPDQAFTGGDPITCTSFLTDRGKAGYHGYWGVNFHREDEHLISEGLGFAELTAGLRGKGLKTVLDIVGNHGSPAWSMPLRQPGFGQVFAADGRLLADHENLHPSALAPSTHPLHAFYNPKPDLAQLGDFDTSNPAVVDYLVSAYLRWIDLGADAFRIDTIRHAPHDFWKQVADRVRAEHPGFFMFGEAFAYEAEAIAAHTLPENGGVSVLDFPLKQALDEVFAQGVGFERLAPALYLDGGPYRNVYELTTFYDNHDMPRMNARDEGFIDAHNWLFTARGIPVIYYGSEMGFMRGRAEHAGNRNYFGSESIAAARAHPIRQHLTRIAQVRAESIALQKGLQVTLELAGERAAFYRVFQHGDRHQIALVLLNKGDSATRFEIRDALQPGEWRSAFDGERISVSDGGVLAVEVPHHGVRVFLLDAPVSHPDLVQRLARLMAATHG